MLTLIFLELVVLSLAQNNYLMTVTYFPLSLEYILSKTIIIIELFFSFILIESTFFHPLP